MINFIEELDYNTLVSRVVAKTQENLDQEESKFSKAKEGVLRTPPASDKIYIFVSRRTTPNQLGFVLSIRNKDLFAGAVENMFLQSPSTQPTKVVLLCCSVLVAPVFQSLASHSQNNFA